MYPWVYISLQVLFDEQFGEKYRKPVSFMLPLYVYIEQSCQMVYFYTETRKFGRP
jgi:hypothetical protein